MSSFSKNIVPLVLLSSASSLLATPPGTIVRRCTGADSIKTSSQAKGRLDWALACSKISKKQYNNAYYDYVEDDDGEITKVPLALPYYPTFGNSGSGSDEKEWPVYPKSGVGDPAKKEAPIAKTAPCPDASDPYQAKYFKVIGWCETAGCYRYDQKVLFQGEEVGIALAQEERLPLVSTLSAGSTMNNIQFELTEVDYYTSSHRDELEQMRHFETASGRTLVVTVDHPLVDENGYMKTAAEFSIGDSLVLESGDLDEIVSLEDKEMFGKVYNLAPKKHGKEGSLESLMTQVIVSQGFLNGSVRYQNGYRDYLGRTVLRENIPLDLVGN